MSVMLLILSFVLGLFLGAISVSLLRRDVESAERTVPAVPSVQTLAAAMIAPSAPTPPAQSVAPLSKYMPVPRPAAEGKKPKASAASVTSRDGKKMCRATGPAAGVVPPSFVVKPAGIPFRCPKCSKTVGRRGPLLTKNALRGHMLKCSG